MLTLGLRARLEISVGDRSHDRSLMVFDRPKQRSGHFIKLNEKILYVCLMADQTRKIISSLEKV